MAYAKLLLSIALDTLSFLVVLLPSFIISNFVEPYRRGFFCDDNSIKFPYKDDTVTHLSLNLGCFLITICIFVILELVHNLTKRSRNSPIQTTGTSSIPQFFVMLCTVFAIFAFGLTVSCSIVNIAKCTVGRLRPHFLSICKPDLTKVNCTSEEHMSVYIEEDVCTREYDWTMMNSRLSFPSGHASAAAYTAVFLALYIQSRMTWKIVRSLRHCLQAMIVFAAVFVCLSRVSDNKHHWSDVFAGACLGAATAALAGLYFIHRFKALKREELDHHETLPYHDLNSTEAPSEKTELLKSQLEKSFVGSYSA